MTEYVNNSGFMGEMGGTPSSAFPGPYRGFLDKKKWDRCELLDYQVHSSNYQDHCFLIDTPDGAAILYHGEVGRESIFDVGEPELDFGHDADDWFYQYCDAIDPHRDLPPVERMYRTCRDNGMTHEEAVEEAVDGATITMLVQEIGVPDQMLQDLVDGCRMEAEEKWSYEPEVNNG